MLNKNKFILTLAGVLALVLMGGAVAFAEQAVPGDSLYRVKIFVNEPIAGIFALSQEEKTEWVERLVERRLEESRKLAFNGNLDGSARVNLQNQIESKINEFNLSVGQLALKKGELTNASNLNIRLQASLKAYQNVLEKLLADTNIKADTKQETEKLIFTLAGFQNEMNNASKKIELVNRAVLDLASVLNEQSMAENLLNSIKLSYQKEKINLSLNIQNQINGKLAKAENLLDEGKLFVASADYQIANDKFQLVITLVNEGKLLLLSNVIRREIDDGDDIREDEDVDDYGNFIEDESFEFEGD